MDARHVEVGIGFTTNPDLRAEARSRLADRARQARLDGRAPLEEFSLAADDHQRSVIESSAQTIRMIAPAGSGKTQTLVNRVLHRVAAGIDGRRILLLTFDKSAADSIRGKLESVSSREASVGTALRDVDVSTLNAFGYRVLRESVRSEYGRVVSPRDAGFRLRKLRRELGRLSEAHAAALPDRLRERVYFDLFSILKNALIDPRDVDEQAFIDVMVASRHGEPFLLAPQNDQLVSLTLEAILWLFRQYDRSLRDAGLLDFDDQKLRAYTAMRDDRSLLLAIRARFDEIIVDEFQDINRLDFVLIKEIAADATLVVTGDDDQAIYGFRGTTPDFIVNLGERLGRAIDCHELAVNYRCPPNLVRHADMLIRHNANRIAKDPRPFLTTPSEIQVVATISTDLEATTIVEYIDRIRAANSSLRYSDFAVLYRTNAQSLPLQVQFILRGVPYFVREEDNLLSNDTLGRLLALLRVRSAVQAGRQPDRADELDAISCYFRRGISADETAELRRLLAGPHELVRLVRSDAFSKTVPKSNGGVADALERLIASNGLSAALDVATELFSGLRGMVGSLEDAVDNRVPLAEIGEVAASFGEDADDFVRTMERALTLARAARAGNDEAGVALLTYFKSKGRQWHTVILTSCNEGLIPHRNADLEDERRLFYVALTRAEANLMVSYVSHAISRSLDRSRFIAEAGLLESGAPVMTLDPGPTPRARAAAPAGQGARAPETVRVHEPEPVSTPRREGTRPVSCVGESDGGARERAITFPEDTARVVVAAAVAGALPSGMSWAYSTSGIGSLWARRPGRDPVLLLYGRATPDRDIELAAPPMGGTTPQTQDGPSRLVAEIRRSTALQPTAQESAFRGALVRAVARLAEVETLADAGATPAIGSPAHADNGHRRLRPAVCRVRRSAVDAPGMGYEWMVVRDHEVLTFAGLGVLARVMCADGLQCELVLPAQEKVRSRAVRDAVEWLGSRLPRISSLSPERQRQQFIAALAGAHVYLAGHPSSRRDGSTRRAGGPRSPGATI